MNFKKILLLLNYTEAAFIAGGYLFSIFYFYNITAPLFSKLFGAAIASIFIIIYIKQFFKKLKENHEAKLNYDIVHPKKLLKLNLSTVKRIAIISPLCCLCLALMMIYEFLIYQQSRFFALKLIICVFLYQVFKESLQRLSINS